MRFYSRNSSLIIYTNNRAVYCDKIRVVRNIYLLLSKKEKNHEIINFPCKVVIFLYKKI